MDGKNKMPSGRAAVWSLAAAGLAAGALGMSPLLAAPPSAGPVPAQAKPIPGDQAAADFQRALGVPLENAGGEGATVNVVRVARTTAQAMAQQARIDADRAALAQRGVTISTTGILGDGATVLVRLINGTQAQASHLLKTYGPAGLTVETSGPVPYES